MRLFLSNIKPLFLFLLAFILLKPVSAFDDPQFSINYDIKYTVEETGETSVTQEAIITNLRNDMIPTTYTFSARQLKIYDVSSTTNEKNSEVRIEEKEDENIISVTIENYAIGEGRQNKVVLNYKTKSVAGKSGEIWNIYIPKIQIPETTSLYNVKISIPASFGPKIYLSPTPAIEKIEDGNSVFYFTKEGFQSTGISGAFGEYQPINFKLKYHLKNTSILPSIKEIALPPDIEKIQNVSYQKINPKPYKIKVDSDGNFIALYVLSPFKDLSVEATGTSRIYGRQVSVDFGRDISEIPSNLLKYTKEDKYWEVNSPYIQKLSKELKSESRNVIENAQNIYDFITKNITYDFEALQEGLVERKGAETALIQKGSWTCMEFTDLFVATSRAMGVPSREINGYAFTFEDQNKPISINLSGGDLLHSWAEFYDPFYGWVQIDPTWGTTSGIDYFTKLDTNHFAFVIKGNNSEYPYPAGTYRNTVNEKLIDIAVAQNNSDDYFIPKLEYRKMLNLNPFKIIKGNKRIKVTNIGNVFVYNVEKHTVPIGESVIIYTSNENNNILFEDLNGKKYTLDISDTRN